MISSHITIIIDNWDIAWSAKQNKLYYHRPPKESTFEIPHDLYAQDIFDCFKTRSLWIFDSSIQANNLFE